MASRGLGAAGPFALQPGVPAFASRLGAGLVAWRHRLHLRRELLRLRDTSLHLLDDIGLDAATVDREIGRRFWQACVVADGRESLKASPTCP